MPRSRPIFLIVAADSAARRAICPRGDYAPAAGTNGREVCEVCDPPIADFRSLRRLLDQPHRLHALAALRADDDMIMDRHPHVAACLDQLLGHPDVRNGSDPAIRHHYERTAGIVLL